MNRNELIEALSASKNALETLNAVLNGDSNEIDMVSLRATVDLAVTAQEQCLDTARQYELLRDDLSGRINGLQRAVAVAEPDTEDERALISADELNQASAEKLIAEYRRVCARFRKAFPRSLNYLKTPSQVKPQRDWSEFRG